MIQSMTGFGAADGPLQQSLVMAGESGDVEAADQAGGGIDGREVRRLDAARDQAGIRAQVQTAGHAPRRVGLPAVADRHLRHRADVGARRGRQQGLLLGRRHHHGRWGLGR